MSDKAITHIIRRLGFCLVLTMFVASPAFSGADYNVDGGGDGFVQNEISLTTVAGQAGYLAMAYNDFAGTGQLGIAYSSNYGSTWNTTQLPFPNSLLMPGGTPGGPAMINAFDPSITTDSSGNLYTAFIATGAQTMGGQGDSGLYVATSLWPAGNGGQTWNPAVTVSYDPPSTQTTYPDPNYRFNDRVQITTDRTAGVYSGNVYVSWIRDRGWYDKSDPTNPPNFAPPSDIFFSNSTNSGGSFSTRVQVNDAAQNLGNMPVPRVGADGTVYVSWLDYDVWNGGTGTIWLDRSTDGGVTWNLDQQVSQITLPPLNVSTAAGASDARAKGAPVLATSPNDANALYIVYAADPNTGAGDEADIYLIRSGDKGASWSSPVRVNNDSTVNDQILPWIDIKPDGTIDVAWYDRRNDANDVLWDVYIAKSTDGGASFSGNVMLNDISFSTPAGTWMGEYLGLAVDSTDAYVAFTSSALDGNGDVYFDRIGNDLIPEPVTVALLAVGAVGLLRRRRQ